MDTRDRFPRLRFFPLTLILLAAWLPLGPALAQHACSGHPDEYMVGVHPGGQGIAATPLCNWRPASQQSAPAHSAPIRLPDVYAAFAADLDGYKLYWATFASSGEDAEALALRACRDGGGKNCSQRGWFSNQCGAIAVNEAGKIFDGLSAYPSDAAEKALEKCNGETTGRSMCNLKDLPVCARYDHDGATAIADIANRRARNATNEEILEATAKLEKRDYWGALMKFGDQVSYTMNHRKREEAIAEAAVRCTGASCDLLATFDNSCANFANPANAKGSTSTDYFAGIDADPVRAYTKAIEACQAKTGKSCAADESICSGRRYFQHKWDWAKVPRVPPPGGSLQVVASGHWEKTWGAYASADNKVFGRADGALDEAAARRIAVSDCAAKGGSGCEAKFAYRNQCAVLVRGGKVERFASAASIEEATTTGLKECTKEGKHCLVLHSGCTEPVFRSTSAPARPDSG